MTSESSVPRVSRMRPVLDPDALHELRERLARVRLPTMDRNAWDQGVPLWWLRELLEDWRRFDTDQLQDRLDALEHLRIDIGRQTLHLVRAAGSGPAPVPLLLVHGWPGSFLEHLPVLGLLTDPRAHGDDPAASFTVLLPSLPGFGFSGPPPADGLSSRQVAALLHRAVTESLAYERFVVHGSDLGAGVAAWLARDHPDSVGGIHLATPGLAVPVAPRSHEEQRYRDEVADWTAAEGGYAHEQSTKPATLGVALTDSPAGLAAWLGEKVVSWSSVRPGGQAAFDRELLLCTLTLYWCTGTATTSLLPYWSARHAPEALPLDDPAPVPTYVSIFGGERVPFPKPPRALAERYFSVRGWVEESTGGHFPAVAEPGLLAQILRRELHPLG